MLLLQQIELTNTPLEGITKQLRVDYPERALDWLSDLTWAKPSAVPLDQIDYTDNIFERVRTKEQAKVAKFAKRISAGWRKPVILIKRPGMPLLKAIDGHTRLVAYKSLNDHPPAMAWVGTAKTKKGPWDSFHKKQLQTSGLWSQVLDLAEYVRTVAGEEWFHEPIGSLIVKHSHSELLAMRTAMQAKYPRSDERVKKIRAAVVASRKAGHHLAGAQESGPSTLEKLRPTTVKVKDWAIGKTLAERDKYVSDTLRENMLKDPPGTPSAHAYENTAMNLSIPVKAVHDAVDRYTAREAIRAYPNDDTALDENQKELLRSTGEYTSAPKYRGISVNEDDPSVQQYLQTYGAIAEIQKKIRVGLEHQAKLVPSVVRGIHVTVQAPKYEGKVKVARPGAYLGGTNEFGGNIKLHPRLNIRRAYSEDNFHVPIDTHYDALAGSLAHEVGHSVHRHLPRGGRDQDLWNRLASAIGLASGPPKLNHTDLAEWKAQYSPAELKDYPSIADTINSQTQESLDRLDDRINTGVIQDWIKRNKSILNHAVSEYGTATPNELLAELWAEYSMSSHPRPAAKVFGEYVKAHIQDKELQPV